jgi:hypothetical protein
VQAASKQQARTVFSYILGFIESSPVLAKEVEAVTADQIKLRGRHRRAYQFLPHRQRQNTSGGDL